MIDAVNRRDFEAALNAYAEDAVCIAHLGIRSGTFKGREAVGRWFGEGLSAFGEDWHSDVEEVRESGDAVLLVMRNSGSGRSSGAPASERLSYVFTLKANKIAQVEVFESRTEALKAVGLQG